MYMKTIRLTKTTITTMALSAVMLAALLVPSSLLFPTRAYAQPCPDGMTLNKGKCVAEPSSVCANGSDPVNGDQCLIQEVRVLAIIDKFAGPTCEPASEIFGFELQLTEDGYCFGQQFEPATQQCTVGTLNSETGLCQTKPGNRA
jgi:hypothetical protein